MAQYLWPLREDLLKPLLNVTLLDALLETLRIPQGLPAEPFASVATECPYSATTSATHIASTSLSCLLSVES